MALFSKFNTFLTVSITRTCVSNCRDQGEEICWEEERGYFLKVKEQELT